jgi:ATP-dependent DNA helicase RecQ
VGCRHRHLVGYFGEGYLRDRCEACDSCLGELEAIDAPVLAARKILSCVARLKGRFGISHVAGVLCGSETEPIRTRGHEKLSTFGLLRDAPLAEVRGYIEQLAGQGLVRQTDDQFPVLTLTPDGVALLKDPDARPDLELVRQRRPTRERPAKRSRAEAESWQEVDRDLFERLRALRLSLARARHVPPYVIFHDTTLREMARLKPTTLSALRGVYGVGDRKAAELGEEFLGAIKSTMKDER